MKISLKYLGLILAPFMVVSLAACEQEGPAEQAGEAVDEAVDSAGDTAEDAADAVGDTVEAASDAVEDAADGN